MKKNIRLFTLLLLLFIAACSSPNSGSPTDLDSPNRSYKQLGSIIIGETVTQGDASRFLSASFLAFNTEVKLPNFSEIIDSCVVTKGPIDFSQIPDSPTLTETPTFLDAGTELSIKSGNNVYATLKKESFNQVIGYSHDTQVVLGDLPDNATIDIPGASAGFPAFNNIALPNQPSSFSLTATPALNKVDKSSSFSWQGSNATFFSLSIFGKDADDQTIVIGCNAKDDGSFSFPATTQAELDAAGFTTGYVVSAGRFAISREAKDNAAIQILIFQTENIPENF